MLPAAAQAAPAGWPSAAGPGTSSPPAGSHTWQTAPSAPPAAPANTNGTSSHSEPSPGRPGRLRSRKLGLPVWLWGAAAVLVIALVIVFAVISSGGGSTTSSSASDAATCPKVVRVLDQQLSGMSLGDITDKVIASPKGAASLLQQYAAGVRQGAVQATADPRLHTELDNAANDAGFAGVAAGTGFGDLGADLTKLAQDVGSVDTACGVTPPFAQ